MFDVTPEKVHAQPVALYSGGGEATKPGLHGGVHGVARFVVLGAVLCALPTLCGCGFGYYARLAVEQGRFLSRAKPIEEVIEMTEDREKRERLQSVLDVREFAAQHGLDPGGSYRTVSDIRGLAVAHVVTAAYRDRLEAYEWDYPFVGSMPYRGYFDVGDAESLAADLRRQGYDTTIVRAAAYSTLGWFDDPLPSSLLEQDRVSLVATVLHELAHQRLFVRDSIAFDETFANAVGLRLAIVFFEERGEQEEAGEAARRYSAWLERGEFYDRLAEQLAEYFAMARGQGRDLSDLLTGRARLYLQAQGGYRQRGLGASVKTGFLRGELDNARFLAMYRYASNASAFDRFFSSFDTMPAALDVLARRTKENGNPFAVLALE